MAKQKAHSVEIDAHALEAALPTLTRKLQELQRGLNEQEKAVFSSIVNSAALHLLSIHAISGTATVNYAKPISAVATLRVRDHLVKLPKVLGLTE